VGAIGRALIAVAALLLAGPLARGQPPSSDLPLPQTDLAIGLVGGAAFGELRGQRGALVGADVGLLHGVLGVHLGVRTFPEGRGQRFGVLAELTVWYVVLLGVGVRHDVMVSGEDRLLPEAPWGVTFLIAVPFPIARLGGGALLVAPYARPGARFVSDGVSGFHEAGLMVRWTSFGF